MVLDKQHAEGLSLEMEEGDEEKLPTVAEARAKFDNVDGALPPKKIPQAAEVKPDILPTVPKASPVVEVGSKVGAPVSQPVKPAVPVIIPEVEKNEPNLELTPDMTTKKSVRKGKIPPPLTLVEDSFIDDWEAELIPLPRLFRTEFDI